MTATPDSTAFPFRERKRKADGTIHDYETELVHRDKTVVIVKFLMTRAGGPPRLPVSVPAGTVSYGFFWPRRPYNVYRWVSPEGVVLAHRFDAVTDVRITDESVDYRDLILDWWALPDDTLLEEDRDELEAAIAAGTISAGDQKIAKEAARQIFSRYRHVVDEVVALEKRFGRGGRVHAAQ